MPTKKTNKSTDNEGGLLKNKKMVVAGAAGAAVAALGAAAAVTLRNKKTRKTVTKQLKKAAATVADVVERTDKAGYAVHHKVTKQLHKTTKPVKKAETKKN